MNRTINWFMKGPVTNLMTVFKNAAIVNSFSKSLALPGERIGYIAVSPNIEAVELMIDGLVFSNRILDLSMPLPFSEGGSGMPG